jgi:DNA-binding NtrC family response regulator
MATQGPPSSKTAPLLREQATKGRASRASVTLYHDDGAETVTLDPGSNMTVGRSPEADVVVPDASLSRLHARFRLIDGEIHLEDLGSTNGTLLNGESVGEAIVRTGDELLLGSVRAIVQGGGPATNRPAPGLSGNDRFVALLEGELVRSRHFGRPLVVLMLRALRPEGQHVRHWWPPVQELLRPVDTAGSYSEDAILVTLPETSEERGKELAQRMLACARPDTTLVCGLVEATAAADSADKLIETVRTLARSASEAELVRTADRASTRTVIATHGELGPDKRPVAESAEMREVLALVERLARGVVPVLLSGETGSGKEVVARFLHESGPRSTGPLVSVNCAAIPEQLVESTLFGHERGAFTGAIQQRKGVFEAAHGGTLLLDEIGELAAPTQAALLRVLDTKRVQRVGSTKEIDIDVRIIAATHRDLEAMTEDGTFRPDLLYRLNAMSVVIPPLRQRRADIIPLATRLLEDASQANHRKMSGFDDDALDALERYAWPGNVRELRNVIERAVVIARDDVVALSDLPEKVRAAGSEWRATAAPTPPRETGPAESPAGASPEEGADNLRDEVDRHERRLIVRALEACGGNQTIAARKLGLPLRTLVYKIRKHGLREDPA